MLRWLKYHIRNYFGFSRSETNGFLILAFLVLIILLITPFFSKIIQPSPIATEADKVLLDSLATEISKFKTSSVSENTEDGSKSIILKSFNPNNATKEELLSLGLSKRVVSNIINYRGKGGKFKAKEDLKKIYGLPEETYQRLYDFIDIPSTKEYQPREKSSNLSNHSFTDKKAKEALLIFDINMADTSQLISLRGIGSKLALRIIKYRDALGGFISKEQFAEVYGLNEDAILSLNERTNIVANYTPERLNINTADYQTLNKHPYIVPNLAKAILAYRKQHGDFKSIEDLKNIKIADTETFNKLSPYLDF